MEWKNICTWGYTPHQELNTVQVFTPGAGDVSRSPNDSGAISLYPNPTTGSVTISGPAGAVTIRNVLGEEVAGTGVREPGSGRVELDLSKLPAGTYFARILTAQDGKTAGGVMVREIIKE